MPDGGLGKEVGGQPVWVWGFAGMVTLGAFLYLRRKGAAASSQQQAGQQPIAVVGSATGLSSGQLLAWLSDHQGSAPPAGASPCPGDMYWDPDANGGRGKCVKEPGAKKKPPPKKRKPRGK